MAFINVLSGADSALLTAGIDITANSFMLVPSDFNMSMEPEFYEGGEYYGEYVVDGDTYAVEFTYGEEVYIPTETEFLDITGFNLSDNPETNGGMNSFVYGNAGSYVSFVTNNLIPEMKIYEYLNSGASFTALALRGNDLIIIEESARVEAFAGNDTILGSNGQDTIFGGKGNDLIKGMDGADIILGASGKDTIIGGAGEDTINGGTGQDRILAGEQSDLVRGGGGNDKLYGEDGLDILLGQNGRDVLVGGKGNDTLTGGARADKFIFVGRAGSDVITDFDADLDDLILRRTGNHSIDDLEITQHGHDVLIDYGKGEILLENTELSDILGADISFN
ncbi:calcium-binding protein [Donghicola sp. C2-DW-16]|uniref:Calcium-binding protein n=1 Tax=Donghicola mangrovi TaxID=2729614 RepID=A0ABX2PG52_9RHOB|nr:calcium-binding protein [Donghicola mangrovi]NVO28049.1 calcium-binding protein [Donghicola mangrovi]